MSGKGRFDKDVAVTKGDGGYQVLLDGKPVRTPAGAPLTLPTRALADAIAQEWRAQGPRPKPQTMPMTRLANTAIDRVRPAPDRAVQEIAGFARADVLCYRAEVTSDLAGRQVAQWDPILAWARERYGAQLTAGRGIGFVAQPQEAMNALEAAVGVFDAFGLAALDLAARVLGSAVLALAVVEGRIGAEESFALAHLDEAYQIERWGDDPQAARRRRARLDEVLDAARFLRVLQA
jgi:chaperone required for assembly of F1-ATPase